MSIKEVIENITLERIKWSKIYIYIYIYMTDPN